MDHFDIIVHGTYDPRLVAVSYVVAVIASYAALDLAGRVTAARGSARRLWLAGGAVTMGLGIWTMHFTGMLAFQLGMPMRYNIPLVVVSFVIAIAASAFALVVASRPTLTLGPLLGGGLCLGLGIAAMHYTGMAAMDVDGAIQYRPLIVDTSLLIAISASVVALWLAFHLRSVQGSSGGWIARKIGSALVMGAAIVGMHYTGMAAATFTTTHAGHTMAALDTNTFTLAIALSVATLLILGIALLSALVDRRFSTQAATFESLFLHSTDAIFALALDGTLLLVEGNRGDMSMPNEPAQVQFDRCTCYGSRGILQLRATTTMPQLGALRCVINQSILASSEMQPLVRIETQQSDSDLKRKLLWQGKRNIYLSASGTMLATQQLGEATATLYDANLWGDTWGSDDEQAQIVKQVPLQGLLRQTPLAEWESIDYGLREAGNLNVREMGLPMESMPRNQSP